MDESSLPRLKAELKAYTRQVKLLSGFLKKPSEALDEQEQLKDAIRTRTDSIIAAFKAVPQDRADRLVFDGLRKEFERLLKEFHSVNLQLLSQHAEHAEELVESFQSGNLLQRRQTLEIKSKEDVDLLIRQERQLEIAALETQLQQVNQMFQEVAEIVVADGKVLDEAQQEVERTEVIVEDAVEQLERAEY